MGSSQGSQWQAAFDLVDVDTNSVPMEVVSCSIVANHTLIESDGIRGTRSRTAERVRRGLINVGGNVVMHFSPTELDALLPCIVGGTETTNVFPLAETVPEFDWMVDTGAKVYDFENCKVDRAVFRSTPGQPLELELDIIGKTVVEGNSGTFPALTFDLDSMYVHSDATFTYDTSSSGADYEVLSSELTIENSLGVRFGNSTTATSIDAQDRRVTYSISTPWISSDGEGSDSTNLYDVSSVSGNDGQLAYVNGSQSLTFAFANMKLAPASTPILQGRQEITKDILYNVYKSGSTNELIITNVP